MLISTPIIFKLSFGFLWSCSVRHYCWRRMHRDGTISVGGLHGRWSFSLRFTNRKRKYFEEKTTATLIYTDIDSHGTTLSSNTSQLPNPFIFHLSLSLTPFILDSEPKKLHSKQRPRKGMGTSDSLTFGIALHSISLIFLRWQINYWIWSNIPALAIT
jgi:hypothetical protein